MGKVKLKSIGRLIDMEVKDIPIPESFLLDLKSTIERMEKDNKRKPSQTYKPSSLACIRNMFFQVIGTEQDSESRGSILIGIGESGTDRHERLQNAVSQMKNYGIDCEYVNVGEYVKSNNLEDIEVVKQSGFETKLFHKKLNMSFLCDGVIKYKGKYYILEIKTETVHKWYDREGVAEEHKNQATAYSLSLNLDGVIFLYENRDNCDKKCYLFKVTDEMRQNLIGKISNCDNYVKNLIPPPKPEEASAKFCQYCNYKIACKKAGN